MEKEKLGISIMQNRKLSGNEVRHKHIQVEINGKKGRQDAVRTRSILTPFVVESVKKTYIH